MSSWSTLTNRRNFIQTTAGMAAALSWIPSASARPMSLAPAVPSELTSLTLRQASDLLKKKEVTSLALTQACLSRIEKYQPVLNAFITVTAQKALARAREMDQEIAQGKWRGPLHGVPIALKDNIDTAGIRTTAASAVFAERIPQEDAPVVSKLKEAGAIMLGKLNMDEFAAGGTSTVTYFRPVHNPWNLDRNAGGSSGGSGAAVAAELCFAALGTDTGGSVRTPASFCGIVGFKPTYGLSSIRSIVPLIYSLDHVGPMCRTVEDAAIVLQVIAGYDPLDAASVNVPIPDFTKDLNASTKSWKIGLPASQFYDLLDPDVSAAINKAIAVLTQLTAGTQEIVTPPTFGVTGLAAETYAYHEPWFSKAPTYYQLSTRKRLEVASKITAGDYIRSLQEVKRVRASINDVFRDVDFIVTPTVKILPRTIEEALKRLESEKPLPPELGNTGPFNLYGIPTISIPCGISSGGLPIGLQISSAPYTETKLLAMASAFERATEWSKRRPVIKI